ncbi:MAG: type transport system ATP-binding protein, partial [Gaiellales bacterium]|nr:type transport system ATP-binding protein [Gaiellales bacterium]
MRDGQVRRVLLRRPRRFGLVGTLESDARIEDRVLDVRGVTRSFGKHEVLAGVDLQVGAGRISALVGPNGAGKTTFLRILTGLLLPDSGTAHVAGIDVAADPMSVRRHIGFFPSGDRTFYQRISGIENLTFFGRLNGVSRSDAIRRAERRLADVGLADAGRQRVGLYSHGMQKRLSMARALLMDPPVLVVDEATDGLDPEGARRVQDLITSVAGDGTAVVWTTQRLDEIRGFADAVTVLDQGRTTFQGTVEDLMLKSTARGYLLRLRATSGDLEAAGIERASAALGARGALARAGSDREHVRLDLAPEAVRGEVLADRAAAGAVVLDCA